MVSSSITSKTVLALLNALPSKNSGSFPRRQPRKTWNELIRSDLKKGK